MTYRGALCSVVAIFVCVSVLSAGDAVFESVGARISVVPDRVDPLAALCRVEWTEDAPAGLIEVTAPPGLDVIASDPAIGFVADATGSLAHFETVPAGAVHAFALDMSRVAPGDSVLIRSERIQGPVRWQLVTRVQRTAASFEVDTSNGYRITHVVGERTIDRSDGELEVALNDGATGYFLVEPLNPNLSLVETVMEEDFTDIAIPDGPTDCSTSSSTWTANGLFYINSAPTAAVSTAITVHVTIVHPVMADLQVAFFYDPSFPGGSGRFLYMQTAGVNLDTDFTRDVFNHTLPGFGESVNGYYNLGARDCTAGSTGRIDYWSLTVEYDSVGTTDLVADSVSATSSSVAPGGTLVAQYAGHVGGTAAVGGPFTNGLYLSTDATISTSDILLSRQTGSWATNPGETFGESSLAVTVPSSVAPGAYHLGVFVDEGNVIGESNEANNIASVYPITVTQTGTPNLKVQSCSVSPSTAAPGTLVTLNWHGVNSGTLASGPFDWVLDLGTTPDTVSSSIQQLALTTVGAGWAAGYDNGTVGKTVQIPAWAADGAYYLGIDLDSNDAVAESNEGDNLCSAAITVTSTPPPTGVTRWLVPAVVSSPGYGTSNWKSQVAVANPTAIARIANLYYVAEGGGWPGTLLSGPVPVGPNASAFLNDPLLALNPTKGLLYVVLDQPGPVVSSRTYNLGSGLATYGQGIPALAFEGVAAPTELILPMIHSVGGLFHTNLGIVQTSPGPFTVEVSVYGSGGSQLASKSYTQTAAFRQINDLFDNLLIGSYDRYSAWVRVRVTSGSPSFWTCYASVVDKQTGDPTFIAPVENLGAK